MKHQSTKLGQLVKTEYSKHDLESIDVDDNSESKIIAHKIPTILSMTKEQSSNGDNSDLIQRNVINESPQNLSKNTKADIASSSNQEKFTSNEIDKMLTSHSFVDNFSLQNLHLAHMAFYQQNPFYYQNLYPFLSSQGVPINRADMLQAHLDQKQQLQKNNLKLGGGLSTAGNAATTFSSTTNAHQYDLSIAGSSGGSSSTTTKRKLDETLFDRSVADDIMPLKKKEKPNKLANFKMFKDEPIPQGYLKFRFNEDCNFATCGYRNHQSHFHCCRNDCYYSFCDKTRFVQHTARHERLDTLMGDDFKQYRANMKCGYDDCIHNKNMGKYL